MREVLWPDVDDHASDYAECADYLLLIAESAGDPIGFAEVGVRSVVEGHDGPAAYLEAIWVAPEHRRRGVSRLLVDAGQRWAIGHGFSHFGSDATLDNALSHRWHAAVGFDEIERLVVFGKALRTPE